MLGNMEWGFLTGDFEEMFLYAYMDFFFLGPEDVVNLNIRAIWNFGKRTRLL
jgi:hypothetical protein